MGGDEPGRVFPLCLPVWEQKLLPVAAQEQHRSPVGEGRVAARGEAWGALHLYAPSLCPLPPVLIFPPGELAA